MNERVKVFKIWNDERRLSAAAVEETVNAWLQENDGKIELTRVSQSQDRNEYIMILVFYRPVSAKTKTEAPPPITLFDVEKTKTPAYRPEDDRDYDPRMSADPF